MSGGTLLPPMTLDEASTLWQRTDYAYDAVETPETPINTADAAAFFLEGYDYARRMLARPRNPERNPAHE